MKYKDHKFKRMIRMEIKERRVREIERLHMQEERGMDAKKIEMMPPYAYTPLCPDPKYRNGYIKRRRG